MLRQSGSRGQHEKKRRFAPDRPITVPPSLSAARCSDVSEELFRNYQLAAAEGHFRTIFEHSPLAIYVLQDARSGMVLDANRRAWQNLGFSSLEELRAAEESVWAGGGFSRRRAISHVRQAVREGGATFDWQFRKTDGSLLWYEVALAPIRLEQRDCVLAICGDVTLRREGERMLRESEERFRKLMREISGVAIQGYTLDGTVIYWNHASETLYGYTAKEALGANLLDLIIPPELRPTVREYLQHAARGGGDIENGELELMRKDGSRVPVFSSHSILRRQGLAPELFCIDIDLSDHKRHQAELAWTANHDRLTDLPNRHLLAELMRERIARADRNEGSFSLCYLDLDEFKQINDQHGQETGDQVLVAIADRLRRMVRGSDAVARLGGDEFVLLLDEVDEGPTLQRRLEFLLQVLAQPVEVDGLNLSVHSSVGVTIYPKDSADADILLRHANQAMFRAKAQGRDCYSLFDLEMEQGVQRRRRRLLEIEQSLEQHEFRLHYQPKVNMQSGEVLGMEGLVRWHHPEQGLLSPAVFLGDLDGSDLERRFGMEMIQQALEQLQQWTRERIGLTISVNISGPHLLHPSFLPAFMEALNNYPENVSRRLKIEILESAAVADLGQAIAVLEQVKRLGIGISLDDFGTGYSSLSHLRSLPVDEVKIDQSFVRDMLTDLSDYNIVRSVVGLAAAFNLKVVAEGVETMDHAALLLELSCETGQGYAFGRPMPVEAVPDWLAAWQQGWRKVPRGPDPDPGPSIKLP